MLSTIVCIASAHAQVITDGTTGPGGALPGPDYEITADLGTRAGDNLFHSFEEFSIDTGESATFSGPDEIANVVSRVTGENPSDIDGTLRSTMPEADFYFINPNGVTFGPNATLDVQGSFHVSTADELRFEGGEVFSAIDPDASGFAVAKPRAFGFYDAEPGAILVDRSTLEVSEGEALSLIGGNITVDGGVPDGVNQTDQGLISAEAGTITLIAIEGEGEVELDTKDTTTRKMADIALLHGAVVRTSGDGGGAIIIKSASLEANAGSVVSASNSGPTDASAGIDIDAEHLRLSGGATIGTVTDINVGAAGRILITADRIEILEQGRLISSTFSGGRAGSITIGTRQLTIDSRGIPGSDRPDDQGGGVFPSINSGVEPGSSGDAGNVTIEAESLELYDAAIITTATFGSGSGGDIFVEADHIVMDGEGSELLTGMTSQTSSLSSGNAGTVTVRSGRIEIKEGAEITTTTFGDGNAGKISIIADEILIDRRTNPVLTGITSRSARARSGDAGDIDISVGRLDITTDGVIATSTSGTGNAGRISIDADQIVLAGQGPFAGGITSDSTPRFAEIVDVAGDAGTVLVAANSLTIQGRSVIASLTDGGGNAGSVVVTADELSIDGRDDFPTGISSSATSSATGDAGTVTVKGGTIEATDAFLASNARGSGSAGDVVLEAEIIDVTDSVVRTDGSGSDGGRIRISGEDRVVLADSIITSNGILPLEGASIIAIDAPLVALNTSRVTSLTGDGAPIAGSGVVDVGGDAVLISNDSVIDASSSVTISGLLTDFSNQLIVLDSQFADASRLLRDSCEAGGDLGGSTFVTSGRSPGIAPDDGLSPGFYSGAIPTDRSWDEIGGPSVLVNPCP